MTFQLEEIAQDAVLSGISYLGISALVGIIVFVVCPPILTPMMPRYQIYMVIYLST